MSAAFLQILLLLAYLAIGLISVTFPIYAISVNYLPSEKWESEKEQKKRIDKLKNTIEKLNKELSGEKEEGERFPEIKQQIENYELEKENLEMRVTYLTAEGAVKNPIIGLIIALFASGAGVYFFYEGNEQAVIVSGIISGTIIALVLLRLYKTISAVEFSALRQARTIDFEVCFASGEEIFEAKQGVKTKIEIGACPEKTVDDFKMMVGLPEKIELIKIHTQPEKAHFGRQPVRATFPTYMAIFFEIPTAHNNIFHAVSFTVFAKKTGEYRIPVVIFAKNTYQCQTWLTLKVSK